MDKVMRRLDQLFDRVIINRKKKNKERRLIATNDPLIFRHLIVRWRCRQAAPLLFRTMTNIDADWESVLWVALICIGFSLAMWIVQAAIELLVVVL